jgi:LacI family transcriptional regulator, galactose operon repressor
MPASIEDVAKLANVSISTVSRVINRRQVVNRATCERVEAAIRKLNYRPNAFARGLMLRKSGIVALILPDLHGEFYSEIIRGANLQSREMGYNLLLSSALPGDDADTWLSAIHQHALVDGLAVMVSDTVATGIGPKLAEFHIPVVVLDDEIEGVEHDSVIIDQREGALALMRHLVEECGRKRVYFVGGLETNIDTQARYKAYRDVLQRAGIKFQKSDVYFLDYSYDSASRLAMEKARAWAGPGHCVFAANDEMAAGIIAGATASNLSIPRDLGVAGFDDTRIAQMTNPLLTTVRVPMSQMGAAAVELLCQRIAEPDRPAAKIALGAELVVRQSCGCRERIISGAIGGSNS